MSALRKKAEARKEQNLEALILTGPEGAYEALQLFRSRAIRLRSKGDNMGAVTTTATAAKCLLSKGFDNAGVEMTNLFIELLNEFEIEINSEIRFIIQEIDNSFLNPKSPIRIDFLKQCVKWTLKIGQRELGDPGMHIHLGVCLWDIQDKTSTYHFACGEAPDRLCQKIMDSYHSSSDNTAREQSLTLGICHFLALENLRDANELFRLYNISAKSNKGGELYNFCDYLLQTCRRDATPLFKQLVNTYATALDFDDNVPLLLTGPVGKRMFGIQAAPNLMNMLQQMLT
jgi:hypothetical protein